jgi:hypothetical protein
MPKLFVVELSIPIDIQFAEYMLDFMRLEALIESKKHAADPCTNGLEITHRSSAIRSMIC